MFCVFTFLVGNKVDFSAEVGKCGLEAGSYVAGVSKRWLLELNFQDFG